MCRGARVFIRLIRISLLRLSIRLYIVHDALCQLPLAGKGITPVGSVPVVLAADMFVADPS